MELAMVVCRDRTSGDCFTLSLRGRRTKRPDRTEEVLLGCNLMCHRSERAALSNCRGYERLPTMGIHSPGSGAERISRVVLVSYWVGRASNMMRARQMYQKTQYGRPSSWPSPRGRGNKGEGINHRKNSMLAGALFAGGVDARPSVRGVATQRGASLT